MKVKPSGPSNSAFLLIPEDADDLLTLRRVIEKGDAVVSDTTRVVKQEKEYARPDKGERVKVRLSIKVDQSQLDSAVDRLRISGNITETDNELVSKGIHHSFAVQPGDILVVDKGRRWRDFELRMLKKSGTGSAYVLVAIDTQEAAVARVSGTHVKVIPNIYSGQSGKRYQTKNNPNIETFFSDVAGAVVSVTGEDDHIIIFGPGETRKRFYNLLIERHQELHRESAKVVDGVDVAGEDGIFVFLRSSAMKEVMSASKLAAVSSVLDQVMLMVNRGESKFAMGLKEVSNAAALKAVETVVFSDLSLNTSNEEEVVKMLNSIESHGAKVFAVDSSTDIGLRVTSLGGIVALLRYSIR
ncbi:MAG: mRNA surveillance protein pelota [Nitrososphaera sp.]